MNRQARRNGSPHPWHDCGAVTHVEAAEMAAEFLAEYYPRRIEFETRDEPTADNPDPPVFRHRVERVVRYEVTPFMGDGDE